MANTLTGEGSIFANGGAAGIWPDGAYGQWSNSGDDGGGGSIRIEVNTILRTSGTSPNITNNYE